MPLLEINWRPSHKDLRWFAAIQLVFFLGVAWVVASRYGAVSAAGAIAAVSALTAIVGVAAPPLVRPLYIAWMAAAFPIGWVMSHLLLAAVYYLVLTPIGLTMRMLGRDPMERRFDPKAESYWKSRPRKSPPERYFKQY